MKERGVNLKEPPNITIQIGIDHLLLLYACYFLLTDKGLCRIKTSWHFEHMMLLLVSGGLFISIFYTATFCYQYVLPILWYFPFHIVSLTIMCYQYFGTFLSTWFLLPICVNHTLALSFPCGFCYQCVLTILWYFPFHVVSVTNVC